MMQTIPLDGATVQRVVEQSRRRILETVCDTPTLFCTAHFPSPSIGRVTRRGDGFAYLEV